MIDEEEEEPVEPSIKEEEGTMDVWTGTEYVEVKKRRRRIRRIIKEKLKLWHLALIASIIIVVVILIILIR